MKHINSFPLLESSDSIVSGSIVLIKGAPINGEKKLFAARVKKAIAVNSAVMLILADDFYRIKKEGDEITSHKIFYNNEVSLKKVLKIKNDSSLSIVKNNNKTPFHWITLKHQSLSKALDEVKNKIFSEPDLLLESSQDSTQEVYNILFRALIETLFFDEEKVIFLDEDVDNVFRDITDDLGKYEEKNYDWTAALHFLYVAKEDREKVLSQIDFPAWIELSFKSQVEFSLRKSSSDISKISTTLDQDTIAISPDGNQILLDFESKKLISEINLEELDFLNVDLNKRILEVRRNYRWKNKA
jgi:hypothetical protein